MLLYYRLILITFKAGKAVMKQYIYHLDVSLYSPEIKLDRADNAKFEVINSFSGACKNLFSLLKRYGLTSDFIKIFIKLITKRNSLYFVKYNDVIASDGLISFGLCSHYAVNKNDCIIGPVNTNDTYAGKGLATFGLVSCLSYLKQKSTYSKVYIDTREDNFAMQKVIKKSGFGEVKSSYER